MNFFIKRGLAIDKTLVSILFDIEIVLWFMRRLPLIRNNFLCNWKAI